MPPEIKKPPEQYWHRPETPARRELPSQAGFEQPAAMPEESRASSAGSAPSEPIPVAPVRKLTPLELNIERVLEEDLAELYQQLTPPEQQEFRRKGESTATQIAALLSKVKVKVTELLELIRIWLRSIPKINSYFVEQEAKIKVDKILRLKR